MRRALPLLVLLTACATAPRRPASDALPWTRALGLEYTVVNDELYILRATPSSNELVLLTAADTAGASIGSVTADKGFATCTNAAMFAADYTTSIGYLRNFGVVNNAHFASKLGGFLLFHPKDAALPLVQAGTQDLAARYDSVVQTYRMWSDAEGILWKPGAAEYERVSLVGVDDAGRILFFHHPARTDVHDLVAEILALELGLRGLLYLDGGHHGALVVPRELGRSDNEWIALPNLLCLKPAG
jgi:hypothetical protein